MKGYLLGSQLAESIGGIHISMTIQVNIKGPAYVSRHEPGIAVDFHHPDGLGVETKGGQLVAEEKCPCSSLRFDAS